MKNNKSIFNIPARFEEHECTLITWPCIGDSEIDSFRKEITIFIKSMAKYEKIILIVDPADSLNAIEQCSEFAEIWIMPTDMSWIRDNGPIFTKKENDEIVAINFEFNGWGNKFYPYDKVKNIPSLIAKKLNIECIKSKLVLEGGGVSFDGEGTMITTEQMLLNPNRNSNFNKQQIESELDNLLGIKKVIWLKKGLVEDEGTDGHVDCVVEYVSSGKIIVQTTNQTNNPNYELLKKNLEILKNEKDANGKNFEIIEMPYLPYFSKKYKNQKFVSPYTNYYIANKAIMVPEVDPSLDNLAFKIIEEVFPDREVVPIPAFYQAIGGGGPGCITQQVPISSNVKL